MLIKKKIKIKNPQGLHARPASIFVKIANKYDSEIAVKKGRQTVNGKSIMGLMMLAANKGTTITVEVNGADAKTAAEELERFLNRTEESDGAEGLV